MPRWGERLRPSTERGGDRAVQQAGILFLAAGLFGLITDVLPDGIDNQTAISLTLNALTLAVGLACSSSLDRHLSGRRSLLLALLGFTDVALNSALGFIPAPTLGIWFVLIFVWLGIWHPAKVSLALVPAALASYLLPFAFGAPGGAAAVGSVLLVVPVALVVSLTLASFVSSARAARLQQEDALAALSRANLTDDLTSLGNRRLGNEMLDALTPGDAIVTLDLDKFKQVNDKHGHARGDQLLQELGRHLSTQLGDPTRAARMGGDEFMIVFPRCTGSDAAARARALVERWCSTRPLATLSAGVASCREGRSPSHTHHLADTALYRAKSQGGNQTVLADADREDEGLPMGLD